MHCEDRLRARADPNALRIHVHRLGIDVDEHRHEPGERHDVRGRRERVGGHEHLVAGIEVEGQHGDVQRRGARRDRDDVVDLAETGELALELGHLRAHREHPALEHLGHLGELGLADVGPA